MPPRKAKAQSQQQPQPPTMWPSIRAIGGVVLGLFIIWLAYEQGRAQGLQAQSIAAYREAKPLWNKEG
ncbi:unnamed protein product [Zymoseptoria tritici ST99CH_1A5]|uniref:Uncharacterized protein n=2 Tax=Zymoseptoria tritici TaxID=1047171 RepID=A0A2H1H8S6_ZYMTR|nr:unnamed protein product [Zymoseptoria tritici ST99CH_1E4]SMR64729.1 unnamed protein product [Zymoseptoria tritici ST99CH_3D1]SMY30070.1 unnamed protein product [Zymoseptoria tritici ST99CH_1A5]